MVKSLKKIIASTLAAGTLLSIGLAFDGLRRLDNLKDQRPYMNETEYQDKNKLAEIEMWGGVAGIYLFATGSFFFTTAHINNRGEIKNYQPRYDSMSNGFGLN